MHSARNLWWGVVLIVLGILLLLDNAGYLDFADVIGRYWPVLLILWGLTVLGRRDRSRRKASPRSEHAAASDASDRLDSSNVFGDTRMRSVSTAFKGGYTSAVFGDTELDLSGVTLDEGEQGLKISAVFGDVDILLPRNIPVAVNASAVFGSLNFKDQHREGISSALSYQTPEYDTASRKLRLHISGVFGDVNVRE